jgi:hypothetical protein
VRRRKQNAIAGRKKVAAGRSSFAGAHELGLRGLSIGRVDRHREHLIAGDAFALVHEDQIFVVPRKIGFGIGPAKCELANIPQVLLGWKTEGSRRLLSIANCMSVAGKPSRPGEEQDEKQWPGETRSWHG